MDDRSGSDYSGHAVLSQTYSTKVRCSLQKPLQFTIVILLRFIDGSAARQQNLREMKLLDTLCRSS